MKKNLMFIWNHIAIFAGALCFVILLAMSTNHTLNNYGIVDSNDVNVLAQTGTTGSGGSSGGGTPGGGTPGGGGCLTIFKSERVLEWQQCGATMKKSESMISYKCDGQGDGICGPGSQIWVWSCDGSGTKTEDETDEASCLN